MKIIQGGMNKGSKERNKGLNEWNEIKDLSRLMWDYVKDKTRQDKKSNNSRC